MRVRAYLLPRAPPRSLLDVTSGLGGWGCSEMRLVRGAALRGILIKAVRVRAADLAGRARAALGGMPADRQSVVVCSLVVCVGMVTSSWIAPALIDRFPQNSIPHGRSAWLHWKSGPDASPAGRAQPIGEFSPPFPGSELVVGVNQCKPIASTTSIGNSGYPAAASDLGRRCEHACPRSSLCDGVMPSPTSFTHLHAPSASCGEVDLRRPFFGGLVAGCEARDGKRERAHDQAQAPTPTTYRHGVQRLLRCRRARRRRSRALHGMARRRRRSMDEGPKWKVVVLAVDDMMRAKRGIFPEPESVQNGRRSRTMPQWGTPRRNLRLLQRLSEPR